MTRLLTTLAMLGACSSLAFAKDFKEQNNAIDFDTPNMNICCSYVKEAGYFPDPGKGPQLACTRVKPAYWIVFLRPDGSMRVDKNPGEVPGCGYGEPIGNVLKYGESWKKDRFECKMARDGITCLAGSKGFKLSRKGLKEIK